MEVDLCGNRALRRHWFAAGTAASIGPEPVRTSLLGQPLVMFRDVANGVAVLPDACSHDGSPLSTGTVADGCIVCPRHGWSFDATGRCLMPPLEIAGRTFPRPSLAAVASRVHVGLVWVCLDEPAAALPVLGADEVTRVARTIGRWRVNALAVMDALLRAVPVDAVARGEVSTPAPMVVRIAAPGGDAEVVAVAPIDQFTSLVLSSRRAEGPIGACLADRIDPAGIEPSGPSAFSQRATHRARKETLADEWTRRIAALLAGVG